MSTPEGADPRWAHLVATAGGLGRLRPGPGTWGSLGAAVLAWLGVTFLPAALVPWALGIGILFCVTIGTLAVRRVIAGAPPGADPSWVVIDEVLGVWLALVVVPPASLVASPGWCIIVATLMFRILDIAKPPPVSTLERLPGAWGIMADDAAAGLLAGAVTALVLC